MPQSLTLLFGDGLHYSDGDAIEGCGNREHAGDDPFGRLGE